MQKWEYLVVYIEGSSVAQDQPEIDVYLDVDKYSEALNNYGEAGWELVNIEGVGTGVRATLKRPKAAEDLMPSIWHESYGEGDETGDA